MNFFTSDTHFGHGFIAGIRGFPDTETHDETLIANWNNTVGKGDTVYHLGDFALPQFNLRRYRARLNGQIHLIQGNHDRANVEDRKVFASVSDLKRVKVGAQNIILCHYAMRVWNKSHHGAWHLYGHSHGSLRDDPTSLSFDVGVDNFEFRPISYDEVATVMATKEYQPVDHHHTPTDASPT